MCVINWIMASHKEDASFCSTVTYITDAGKVTVSLQETVIAGG